MRNVRLKTWIGFYLRSVQKYCLLLESSTPWAAWFDIDIDMYQVCADVYYSLFRYHIYIAPLGCGLQALD